MKRGAGIRSMGAVWTAATVLVVALSGRAQDDRLTGELIVFHAGSLSVPFSEVADAFSRRHPGVRVLLEAAGSRTCARKISDLNRPCDVMASADYTVIDTLLIPEHAAWNIPFATNEMAIACRNESRHADEINSTNWPDILTRPGVRYGRSDPNSDPCGYRSVLTIQLAERHYGRPGLAARLLADGAAVIRPKETDLLALLEVGEIDYLFIYRSVAQQHGLPHLLLPDEINLKLPRFAHLYRTASVDITGRRPGETVTKVGGPMVYGITIPRNPPNPTAALAFVRFVLGPQGQAIMERNGQPSAVPSPTDTFENLPEGLREFARPE